MIYNFIPDYKELSYRLIFLYGVHFFLFIVFFLSLFVDFFYQSYDSLLIDSFGTTVVLYSYYIFHTKNDEQTSIIILTSIMVLSIFSLVFINHSKHMDIVYLIVFPIFPFYVFRFKTAMIVNLFVYFVLTALYYYIYLNDPNDLLINNVFILMNVVFATILVLFFGLFYHFGIRHTLKELKHSNKQKDILLQEVHHRVKNNLNLSASMIGLQILQEEPPVQNALLKTKNRLKAIATIYEILYANKNFEHLSLYTYIKKLEKLIRTNFNNKFTLHIDAQEHTILSLEVMVQIALILNELLTNSLQHAEVFEELQIQISLKKEQDTFMLSYCDNGEENTKVENIDEGGIGLKLIQLSVKQIDGELQTYYDKGLHYEIRFKDDENYNS